MRRALLTAALSLLAGACQVDGEESSLEATCDQLAEVTCSKFFECFTPEELAAAMVPASEADCVAATRADYQCASQTLDTTCAAGTTYDPVMGSQCIEQYRALSCDALRNDLEDTDTPACAQVCR